MAPSSISNCLQEEEDRKALPIIRKERLSLGLRRKQPSPPDIMQTKSPFRASSMKSLRGRLRFALDFRRDARKPCAYEQRLLSCNFIGRVTSVARGKFARFRVSSTLVKRWIDLIMHMGLSNVIDDMSACPEGVIRIGRNVGASPSGIRRRVCHVRSPGIRSAHQQISMPASVLASRDVGSERLD